MIHKHSLLIIAVLLIISAVYPGTAKRIQPSDLKYLGAFRLPDGESGSDVKNWTWAGEGLAYYPRGDSFGPSDGYPGSLFGTGHNWAHMISEVTIPVPVISASKNLSELNTASTLQKFYDILNVSSLELPRSDLQYLPAQGSQTSGKMYYCRGAHYQEPGDLTHGWFELNLSNPKIAGNWALSGIGLYSGNDYIMDIPSTWAASHTPGMLLASGRFRDGGWSGQGPSLIAFGPWNQGNPPVSGAQLNNIPLLLYTSTEDWDSPQFTMNDYHHADQWSGAAWLTVGSKSAVIFAGTKGTGNCWYGFANGVVWPESPPYPAVPAYPYDSRGWWSSGFEGRIIFYDTDDLAAVADSRMNRWEPQPYAYLDIDDVLFNNYRNFDDTNMSTSGAMYHTGAVTFDRDNSILYMVESLADGDKSIIHAWKVTTGSIVSGPEGELELSRSKLTFGCTTSFAGTLSQTFRILNLGEEDVNWSVGDNAAWISVSPGSGSGDGLVTVRVNPSGFTAGTYHGTVSVSSDGIPDSPLILPVVLNVYGSNGSSGPFGSFDLPLTTKIHSGSIAVTGWALDDTGVEKVSIYRVRNGVNTRIDDAILVEGAREDVEIYYPDYPYNNRAGWGYMLLTNYLPDGGNGTYTLYAEAVDFEGNRASLGTRTITCDNANAVKPFGAIDTPSQGGIASGSTFVNFGWVLTPRPNMIPADGSTIHVIIDGIRVGSPVYNQPRSDIQRLFPDYLNSNGAAGYFYLDTTAYENGVHTIQWTVSDNAGNTDGIGSRFFTIQNSGSRISTETTSTDRKDSSKQHTESFRGMQNHPPAIVSGYDEAQPFRELRPSQDGVFCANVPMGEPIRLRLFPGCKGFAVSGNLLKKLPAGSHLDREKGIFYWQPGPGFLGNFRLIFTDGLKTLTVTITIGDTLLYRGEHEKLYPRKN